MSHSRNGSYYVSLISEDVTVSSYYDKNIQFYTIFGTREE